jgi:hypothetical protein
MSLEEYENRDQIYTSFVKLGSYLPLNKQREYFEVLILLANKDKKDSNGIFPQTTSMTLSVMLDKYEQNGKTNAITEIPNLLKRINSNIERDQKGQELSHHHFTYTL